MEKQQTPQATVASDGHLNIFAEPLVLASASPRRVDIMIAAKLPFRAVPADIDESPKPSEEPVAYVERLAREKAEAAAKVATGIVLGADTTVVVDGDMLAKPVDAEDATRMLNLLRGRWHEVLTGVALHRNDDPVKTLVAHQVTRVRFASMTDEEVAWYVGTGEPMDKAGAYAVQGRAALFIEEIQGEYLNIVGLPLRLVYKMLKEFREG